MSQHRAGSNIIIIIIIIIIIHHAVPCWYFGYLDGVHDPVGKHRHLARHSLHPLFELCDVWARGEDIVQAG